MTRRPFKFTPRTKPLGDYKERLARVARTRVGRPADREYRELRPEREATSQRAARASARPCQSAPRTEAGAG